MSAGRHPYFSIGEGTFREKEERIIRQGLNKKKDKKENNEQTLPKNGKLVIVNGDTMWVPKSIINENKVNSNDIFKKNIKDKIWGK